MVDTLQPLVNNNEHQLLKFLLNKVASWEAADAYSLARDEQVSALRECLVFLILESLTCLDLFVSGCGGLVDPVIVVEQAFSLESKVALVKLLLVIIRRLGVFPSSLKYDEASAIKLKLGLNDSSDTLRARRPSFLLAFDALLLALLVQGLLDLLGET